MKKVLLLVLCLTLLAGCSSKRVKTKEQDESKVYNTINGIQFKDTKIVTKNKKSIVTLKIVNTMNETQSIEKIKLYLHHKNGNLVMVIEEKIKDDLVPNKEIIIQHETDSVLKNIDITKTEYAIIGK